MPATPRLAALILIVCSAAACGGAPPEQDEWIAASDSLATATLVDVLAVDGTFLVEARYATADNFTGAVLPGYEAGRILLRREVAAALARVQAALRDEGLGIKLFDGYRPMRATQGMVAWAERTDRVDLLDDGYVGRRSRHNLGVAVDLTLVDLATGEELDMGTVWDTFDAAAHTMNAEGEVLARRLMLKDAMEAEGFVHYTKEWWHFSYPVEGATPFDLVITDTALAQNP